MAGSPPSNPSRSQGRHVLLAPGWYSHKYHRGVAAYAKNAGWSLDAGVTHMGQEYLLRDPASLAKHYDGIICCLPGDPEMSEFVRKSGLPAVDLAAQPPYIALPRVLMNNEAQGRLVAEEFLRRGFKNLASCCFDLRDWAAAERHAGFRARAELGGCACALLDWSQSCGRLDAWNREALCQWLAQRLADLPKPLGVMANNDDFAVLVLDACLQAGLLVPEQVALIGCDNDELVCEFARIPLSSVDANMSEQARRGAELLDRLMSGEPPPSEPIRVEPKGMAIRQSSDILAIDKLPVARALRYIWSQYANPLLSVPDVAEASGLSVRGLSKLFRGSLNRTVSEEIRKVRVGDALQRLAHSEDSIGEIATQCGFASGKHLRQTLKRETGSGPRQYRSHRD
jgi:LacI family transcriptional regulator